MLVPIALAISASFASIPACDDPAAGPAGHRVTAAPRDSVLAALYASGQDFRTFLAEAKQRRETWVRNSEQAVIAPDVLATARGLMGKWRILVVAVDSCSDSANTIPYIAKLVELVPSLEMRIVLPGPGARVMEEHRTPDGRAATPTLVLLDPSGNEVGCLIERPSTLQKLIMSMREAGTLESFQKQKWYDEDAGATFVREMVTVLQAAASGSPRCDAAR